MEELLPILIGVIWFVYKMYQGAQKKSENQKAKQRTVQKAPQQPIQQEPEMNMDELMKTIFGVQNSPKSYVHEEIYPDSVESNYQNVDNYESNHYESIEDDYEIHQPQISIESVENDNITLHQKLSHEFDEEPVNENTENEYIIEDFDVRKAIIYNAILNRPYS